MDLRLDTLNTFREQIEFTAETHVTRRLQNRWTVTDSDTLYPVVSKTSEPFSVNFIETADKAITDEAVTAAEKWYIV